ncbi:phytochromobilin:ferredoxin oxidoreductase, chloroplastic isoform X4 [Elaeis guineensis]|uniref:Phytochromobilin:ferredoxin oxidoreductase, chloroplastic isoform X3 n=1 Tax=Elaeis guineensis var. tenera TaxID=51953 RepID=A0A6I9RC74_ELAGV|nr:phytochromobilin:ferredoxin oxidoreductase, chloroplastic isoform X3 [Elaeis guineensis]
MDLSALSYQKFVHIALEETQRRTILTPLPSQEKLRSIKTKDDTTMLHGLSFSAPKIRLLRSLTVEGSQAMKVLDFAAFSKPEFDLPIFCANFFLNANLSIVVLDLNPLYDVTIQRDYKEKYYMKLMPLGQKYAETWLELMDQAVEETDALKILRNCEAQHKYLTWRAEKDPGHPILKRLIGEKLARDLLRHFLFEGVDTLGTRTFLDYFPEYRCKDGSINQKRSIIGKSYETRPWDARGEFIGNEAG